MTRLCVIGSSHVAALKAGWESIRDDHPDIAVDFFAAGAERLADLVVADGKLVADAPAIKRTFERIAGRGEIADDYDRYAVCGMKFTVYRAIALSREFRPGARAEAAENDGRAPMSDAAFRAALLAALHTTAASPVLRKVRAITKAPIVFLASPMPRDIDEPNRLNRLKHTAEGAHIAALFHQAAATLAAERDASYAQQPEATLASPLTTKREYAAGGVHLSDSERADDEAHMNADYGAAVMGELLEQFVR